MGGFVYNVSGQHPREKGSGRDKGRRDTKSLIKEGCARERESTTKKTMQDLRSCRHGRGQDGGNEGEKRICRTQNAGE